jgi:hypothetical protein
LVTDAAIIPARKGADMSEMITVTNYFGGCPTCGQSDGYLNAGRSHRFFCKEHKTAWLVGSNLFSDWRRETEEEQREKWDAVGLDTFEDVDPLPEGTWSTDPEVRCRELDAAREEAVRRHDEAIASFSPYSGRR